VKYSVIICPPPVYSYCDQYDLGSKAMTCVRVLKVQLFSCPSYYCNPATATLTLHGNTGIVYPEVRHRIVSGNACWMQDPRDLELRYLEGNVCLFPLLNSAQRLYEAGSTCGKLRYLALHGTGYMHDRCYLV
jgi:hypothetical protein